MAFDLGRKVLIVNDAAQAELLFYSKHASGLTKLVETDDDYQTTTAFDDLAASPDTQSGAEGSSYSPADSADDETIAQADLLRILGFGDFTGAEIAEVIGSKGILGVKQISTLTFTVDTPVAGQEFIAKITFIGSGLRGDLATHLSDYKKYRSFVVVASSADTATTIAAKLKAQIDAEIEGTLNYLTVSAAAGELTFTSTDAEVTFSISSSGTAVDAGTVTAVFATTTAGYEGRNSWTQLKGLRLPTVNGPFAEEFKTAQVPVKGAKYSAYLIKKNVSRPDLAGFGGGLNSIPTGQFEFLIYINETQSAYITALTKWLNANVARRIMYTATAASDAIAAENPTPTTVVDSSEPFTTGLS